MLQAYFGSGEGLAGAFWGEVFSARKRPHPQTPQKRHPQRATARRGPHWIIMLRLAEPAFRKFRAEREIYAALAAEGDCESPPLWTPPFKRQKRGCGPSFETPGGLKLDRVPF